MIKRNCRGKKFQLPPYIPTTVCRRARRPQKTQQRRIALQVVTSTLNLLLPGMSQKTIEREYHQVSLQVVTSTLDVLLPETQKTIQRENHQVSQKAVECEVAAVPLKSLTEGIICSKRSIYPKEFKQ